MTKSYQITILACLTFPLFVAGQTIGTFPHTEDFEGASFSYFNTSGFGDDFDWSLNSGATGSPGTGPSADHTSGSGSYVYTESSNPNYPNKSADLVSSTYDFSNLTTANFTFWWHQYASNSTNVPGYFLVYVSTNNQNYSLYYQEQYEYNGIDDWRQAYIDLSPL
ncbi:MAG TPA: hypothetical protein EYM84_05260, partial [Flavobacteriales bacterium]|nr:hypothetical protein [Flavobacteriales bacterium]